MPGFSFSTGNAKKLATLPFYALGSVASILVPRASDRWVFGCGSGIGEGSLALFRFARVSNPALRLSWLARDEHERLAAMALGIPAVVKSSPRGLWLTLRARVVVITHGFGDVNRYGLRGAFVTQLWHGVPLKLIQLDSATTTRISVPLVSGQIRDLLRRFYRRGYRAISLMPAASDRVAGRLRSAFALPTDRVVVTGDPRDDVLVAGTETERVSVARTRLLRALGVSEVRARLVLLAPTWRDGDIDPGVPSADEWIRIDAWLRSTDTMLVVRPHPLSVGDYAAGAAASDRVCLLTADTESDVTPLLPAIDLLITDYSSIAFDYSLTGGVTFFLAADEESYTQSRGLYEPYREFSGGREVHSWDALLAQLVRFDEDPVWAASVRRHSMTLRDRHFDHLDGRNTERVYTEILRRVEADR